MGPGHLTHPTAATDRRYGTGSVRDKAQRQRREQAPNPNTP